MLSLFAKLPRCVSAVETISLLFNRVNYSISVDHVPQFIEQVKKFKLFSGGIYTMYVYASDIK